MLILIIPYLFLQLILQLRYNWFCMPIHIKSTTPKSLGGHQQSAARLTKVVCQHFTNSKPQNLTIAPHGIRYCMLGSLLFVLNVVGWDFPGLLSIIFRVMTIVTYIFFVYFCIPCEGQILVSLQLIKFRRYKQDIRHFNYLKITPVPNGIFYKS